MRATCSHDTMLDGCFVPDAYIARVVPAAELKAETRKFAERLAQNPPAAISGTKSLVHQAAVTPTKQQLDAEEAKIIDCMHTEDFRIAVKKFTSKSK